MRALNDPEEENENDPARKLTPQEIEAIARQMGLLHEGETMQSFKSQFQKRIPEPELPPAQHQFAFPLTDSQLALLSRGDEISEYPLERVIKRLNAHKIPWTDPIGRKSAPEAALGKTCVMRVESIDSLHQIVTVQAQLPHSTAWLTSRLEVVDLTFADLMSFQTRLSSFFKR